MSRRGPTIGLVLGGGGIAGYAFHCAVLAALEEETGFDPRTAEIVVGTSAGAISGAAIRGDVPMPEMRDRILSNSEYPQEMAMTKVLTLRSQKAIPRVWVGPGAPRMVVREIGRGRRLRISRLVAALLPSGRQELSPVSEPMEILHGPQWPARALWIPAIDLRTGRLVVFGRDRFPPVAAAVAASAALPVLFAPVMIDGRSYIDGGVGSPFNADLLIGYTSADHSGRPPVPLDLVIISAPLSIDEFTPDSPVSSIARSLPRRRLRGEIRRIEDTGTRTLVFQPGRAVARAMGLNPMDHRRVEAIVSRSDELVRRQITATPPSVLAILEQAARQLKSPPDVPYPSVDHAMTAG